MENALTLAHVIGPVYLVVGLSILMYVKAWESLMTKYENDHHSLMPAMLLYGVLGGIILNMYNVWTWDIWLLVTLTGWGLALKSMGYFLLPGSFLKKCFAIKKKPEILYTGGAVGVIFGVILTYLAYLK